MVHEWYRIDKKISDQDGVRRILSLFPLPLPSGPIPATFGNMTEMQNLWLEDNHLSGMWS